jgi:hypothetical protein
MRFNIGDKVRVKNSSDQERTATVLDISGDEVKVGIGETYYFNYEEKTFPQHKVLAYFTMTDEDADNIWRNEMPRAFDYAKQLFAKFLPDSVVEYDEKYLTIRETRTGICLAGEIMERRSISQVREYAGYAVTAEQYVPGCRTMPNGDPGYPDDVDVVNLGSYDSYMSAIVGMAKEVFAENLRATLEREAEDMMAQMMLMDDTN